MRPRFSRALTLCIALLISALASAQSISQGTANTQNFGSSGGLIITVLGEKRTPLDRQAVVKVISRSTQNVVYQTTDKVSEASFSSLDAGVYDVEISAFGYLTTKIEVTLSLGHVTYRAAVNLKKDPTAIELSAPTQQQVPPKARKDISEGVSDLKSGKLKSAQKHLNAANDLVPSNSDVKFLLGYLSFQQKDFKQANVYLMDASNLDAHNVQTLTLLGRVEIQLQDYAAASQTLQRAVAADPNSWMAHELLAETYLKLKDDQKALVEAQLALDKGHIADNPAQIALGQALEHLGREDEAVQAYKKFVHDSPSSPLAPQVLDMENALLGQPVKTLVPTKKATSSPGADILLSASEPGLIMKTWAPPGIDDVKPPVAAGVACPYDQVIDEAGERVKQLVDDVGRFNAIEEVLHEDLDALGNPITKVGLKFNYVAYIAELQPGIFSVGEFRDEQFNSMEFPDKIATRGLPTLALIFHPDVRDTFQMTCEGLGDWQGQATWLVRFQQREDRPKRIQEYEIQGIRYPISLKGRAWISADTFHIVHLETDLVNPMPEIQLLGEHMAVDYAPVLFAKKNVELWLPKSAELYFDFRRHRYFRRHSFDHFMLFSVDSTEKRKEPKASTGGSGPPVGSNQN